jgi:hypothetical protein
VNRPARHADRWPGTLALACAALLAGGLWFYGRAPRMQGFGRFWLVAIGVSWLACATLAAAQWRTANRWTRASRLAPVLAIPALLAAVEARFPGTLQQLWAG